MIHITEISADKAALQIADVMDERGGQWLVNAVDDEGYIMAREGSRYGKSLARSGSPSLTGPFDARCKVSYITDDLTEAKACGLRRVSQSRVNPDSVAGNVLFRRMAAMLQDGPTTATTAAKALGITPKMASITICKLVGRGLATRAGKTRTGLSGRPHFLYEAA